jgi:hypothetical protein
MPYAPPEHLASFSLVQGGPIYRVERRFGLVREGGRGLVSRASMVIGVTFLPLVVLAAAQGVLFGSRVAVPLTSDLTIYARFLFAIPLLLSAESSIDPRLNAAVKHFRTSGLLEGKAEADFEGAIGKLERARDSFLPEFILLLGAFAFAWFSSRAILGSPVSTWRAITPGLESSTTLAGRCLDLVSLPIFNFLMFRWLWRMLLWSFFLVRVSRIDLKLVPTHPDGAAGLGFLGGAHTAFGAFLVPLAVTVGARGVQWVQYGGGTLESLRNALIAFLVVGLAITLGPLLVFAPRLMVVKRRGLLEYGNLASDYTRRFDQKWVHGNTAGKEPLLGTGDIQSLADLGNSFGTIKAMRVMPPNFQHAKTLVLAAALPLIPLLALIMPVEKVLKQLLQLVMR